MSVRRSPFSVRITLAAVLALLAAAMLLPAAPADNKPGPPIELDGNRMKLAPLYEKYVSDLTPQTYSALTALVPYMHGEGRRKLTTENVATLVENAKGRRDRMEQSVRAAEDPDKAALPIEVRPKLAREQFRDKALTGLTNLHPVLKFLAPAANEYADIARTERERSAREQAAAGHADMVFNAKVGIRHSGQKLYEGIFNAMREDPEVEKLLRNDPRIREATGGVDLGKMFDEIRELEKSPVPPVPPAPRAGEGGGSSAVLRKLQEKTDNGKSPISQEDLVKIIQDEIKKPLDDLSKENSEDLKKILDRQDGQAADLAELTKYLSSDEFAEKVSRVRSEERRQLVAQRVDEIHRSLNVLAFVWPDNQSPQLKQQVIGVSRGVLDIAATTNQFIDKLGKFKGMTNLGKSLAVGAFTGDVLGIVKSVFSLFAKAGPSADEIIIGQLNGLREDLFKMWGQMHERFDLIDRRLDWIHRDLREGFDDVLHAIDKVRGDIWELRGKIDEFQREVRRMENRTQRYMAEIIRQGMDLGRTELGNALPQHAPPDAPFKLSDFKRTQDVFINFALTTSRGSMHSNNERKNYNDPADVLDALKHRRENRDPRWSSPLDDYWHQKNRSYLLGYMRDRIATVLAEAERAEKDEKRLTPLQRVARNLDPDTRRFLGSKEYDNLPNDALWAEGADQFVLLCGAFTEQWLKDAAPRSFSGQPLLDDGLRLADFTDNLTRSENQDPRTALWEFLIEDYKEALKPFRDQFETGPRDSGTEARLLLEKHFNSVMFGLGPMGGPLGSSWLNPDPGGGSYRSYGLGRLDLRVIDGLKYGSRTISEPKEWKMVPVRDRTAIIDPSTLRFVAPEKWTLDDKKHVDPFLFVADRPLFENARGREQHLIGELRRYIIDVKWSNAGAKSNIDWVAAGRRADDVDWTRTNVRWRDLVSTHPLWSLGHPVPVYERTVYRQHLLVTILYAWRYADLRSDGSVREVNLFNQDYLSKDLYDSQFILRRHWISRVEADRGGRGPQSEVNHTQGDSGKSPREPNTFDQMSKILKSADLIPEGNPIRHDSYQDRMRDIRKVAERKVQEARDRVKSDFEKSIRIGRLRESAERLDAAHAILQALMSLAFPQETERSAEFRNLRENLVDSEWIIKLLREDKTLEEMRDIPTAAANELKRYIVGDTERKGYMDRVPLPPEYFSHIERTIDALLALEDIFEEHKARAGQGSE